MKDRVTVRLDVDVDDFGQTTMVVSSQRPGRRSTGHLSIVRSDGVADDDRAVMLDVLYSVAEGWLKGLTRHTSVLG